MTGGARGRLRRWAVVTAGLAVLVSLPALVGAVPAASSGTAAVDLRARVLASAAVPHSGYAVARGGFELPDVPRTGDLGALLGGTSRLRVWWAGPEQWRVDRLEAAGEIGTFASGDVRVRFDSVDGFARRTVGDPALRLPAPVDLLPDALARRLLGSAAPEQLTTLPARRVAGRDADGLRLAPDDPRLLVAHVDVWVERTSGLPVEVQVLARGERVPTVVSRYLDLELDAPAPEHVAVTDFEPRIDVLDRTDTDVAQTLDRLAPYALPDELVGLPRRERVRGLDGETGGTATYGDGLALLAVAPLPRDLARDVLAGLEPPNADRLDPTALDLSPAEVAALADVDVRLVETPLAGLVAARVGDRRAYVLTGTVDTRTLAAALAALAADPPGRR